MADLFDGLAGGVAFLCGAQEPDGAFRDWAMEPGASDGWMTGLVSVSLSDAGAVPGSGVEQKTVRRAGEFLAGCFRSGGWGYNRHTATDGDSTAYAVRALLRAGLALPDSPEVLLGAYVDPDGCAHTYRESRRMGNWAGAHPDVTPSVGLALLEAGSGPEWRQRMVAASLSSRNADGLWTGYWWIHPYYPTWLNLEWLRSAGALTPSLAESVMESLSPEGELSVLDLASLVGIQTEVAAVLGKGHPRTLARYLIGLQRADGSWPPSLSLLLPSQGREGPAGRYADLRALFTTSAAVRALSRLLIALAGQ